MKRALAIAAVTLGGVALVQPIWAQDTPQPPAPEQTPPTPPKDDPLPSLDDLLGLPRDRESGRRPPAQDPSKAELERELSPVEAAEQFREAVDLMGQTATRLTEARDTGLQTQRLQDDIVRKLDMLIKAAEQQAQRTRRSSSRPSSGRPQGDQPNQPGQQQGERQQAGQGENRGEIMPPARQEGPLNPELAARGAAWGALPQRVRDALLQGTQDKFSAMYQRLTEEYYRKLAEESK